MKIFGTTHIYAPWNPRAKANAALSAQAQGSTGGLGNAPARASASQPPRRTLFGFVMGAKLPEVPTNLHSPRDVFAKDYFSKGISLPVATVFTDRFSKAYPQVRGMSKVGLFVEGPDGKVRRFPEDSGTLSFMNSRRRRKGTFLTCAIRSRAALSESACTTSSRGPFPRTMPRGTPSSSAPGRRRRRWRAPLRRTATKFLLARCLARAASRSCASFARGRSKPQMIFSLPGCATLTG